MYIALEKRSRVTGKETAKKDSYIVRLNPGLPYDSCPFTIKSPENVAPTCYAHRFIFKSALLA